MSPVNQFIDVQTKSGRRFRFNITDYAVSADTTRAQVDAIAAKIVADKYRCCQWDKDHPTVNVEAEMLQEVTTLLLHLVDRMKKYEASHKAGSTGFDPVRFMLEHSESVTTSLHPSARGRQAPARSKVLWGVYDDSGQLVATFGYADEKKAKDLAAELTEQKRSPHFVQQVKRQEAGE
jgi:hypothetical protein